MENNVYSVLLLTNVAHESWHPKLVPGIAVTEWKSCYLHGLGISVVFRFNVGTFDFMAVHIDTNSPFLKRFLPLQNYLKPYYCLSTWNNHVSVFQCITYLLGQDCQVLISSGSQKMYSWRVVVGPNECVIKNGVWLTCKLKKSLPSML